MVNGEQLGRHCVEGETLYPPKPRISQLSAMADRPRGSRHRVDSQELVRASINAKECLSYCIEPEALDNIESSVCQMT